MVDQAETLREMFVDYKKNNNNSADQNKEQVVNTDMNENNNTDNGSNSDKKKSNTNIITIASGKGGVGKSTLTVNIGLSLAKKGKNVTIMDADFGLANINIILGVLPKFTLYHVFKGQKKLKDIIINIDENFDIIAGASGFRQLVDLTDKERKFFIQEMESLNHKDFLLIDVGAGISENVLSMIKAADESFIITTPEPTAIADAYGIVKAIASYDKTVKVNIIVNRVKSFSEAKYVAHRIINIAEQFLKIKVNYMGFVFEDKYVEKSIKEQEPLIYNYPKSRAGICIEDIVHRIIKTDTESEKTGLKDFFKKFLNI